MQVIIGKISPDSANGKPTWNGGVLLRPEGAYFPDNDRRYIHYPFDNIPNPMTLETTQINLTKRKERMEIVANGKVSILL